MAELLKAKVPDIYQVGPKRHIFAIQGKDLLEDWDEYFKFALVRNPWDRLASWYSMIRQFEELGIRTENEMQRYVCDNSSSFEQFVDNCTGEVEMGEGVRYSFAYNQLDYVTDKNGDLLVDFIGRYENFNEDLREALGAVGIGFETTPHKNRSAHRHYSTFYTPETERIVRHRFKRDIEYFGYEFERPRAYAGREFAEKLIPSPEQEAQKKVEIEANRASSETRADVLANPTSRSELSEEPRLLFVCGYDSSGATVLVDCLNRHPEILICQERFKDTTPMSKITPDLFSFERILDFEAGEAENPSWKNGDESRVKYHSQLLADKDPTMLRWIGDNNPEYARQMKLVAGNNPGARFMVVYHPIEEIVEAQGASAKDADDIWDSHGGFELAVRAWNKSLRKTREFIENSLTPRVLLINYHDFVHQNDAMISLISRFLGLEFNESVTAGWAEMAQEFGRGKRLKEALTTEQQHFIEEHADRATEAWILDRIDEQWTRPGLYIQKIAKPALAASLDKTEAKTWRLQRRVKQLERDLARSRREVRRLQRSRRWKLMDGVARLRARLSSKNAR